MDYGYGYDIESYIPLTVFEHFDWNADQSTAQLPQYIYDEARDSYQDNEILNVEGLNKIPGTTLGINAMVTVDSDSTDPLNGVIRVIFQNDSVVMVGVELEDAVPYFPLNLTDGLYSGRRFFHCPTGRALFVDARCVRQDIRFSDDVLVEKKVFGHPESPIVREVTPPISIQNLQELDNITGESRGIQGHNNSCYLDATLFSMFTFAQCFDSLLYRPVDSKDIKHYDKVCEILRDEIVHPLRKHHFVRADRVLKLRELLEEISSMTGLTSEEKDPEEFMNILMAQTLRAEPYLKFNSGQDSFYYQLFVEKNDALTLPNVQQLFEQSFKTSNIKLRETPPCLIIQMPRFGRNYKMYPRIVPSQILDITDVVEGQPPACNVCGILADTSCLDCPQVYCSTCHTNTHTHQNQNHKSTDILTDFPTLRNHQTVPRIHMDLFAVVCIETSHYVSFVKAGELPDAPWIFFDSMSDRRGGQNGYNIPSMIPIPDLPEWLSDEGARNLHDSTSNDKLLPPFAKRLLCDAYMCMYVSRDVSMYK
ncbi:Ubiquitin carboxyl-terminal hydrolase CYLD, partial [Pseudolycoriella hygida]